MGTQLAGVDAVGHPSVVIVTEEVRTTRLFESFNRKKNSESVHGQVCNCDTLTYNQSLTEAECRRVHELGHVDQYEEFHQLALGLAERIVEVIQPLLGHV